MTESREGSDAIPSPQGHPAPLQHLQWKERGPLVVCCTFQMVMSTTGVRRSTVTRCECGHCLAAGHQQSHCSAGASSARLCLANPALEWGEELSSLPTPAEQLLAVH